MTTEMESQVPFSICAYDYEKHNRETFSCGVDQVDNYLKRTAKKRSKDNFVRIWVIVDEGGLILGYYGVTAHSISVEDMPDRYRKKVGKDGRFPAAFIVMIGVDEKWQGKGMGTILLTDALKRIARFSDDIAIGFVVLDVFDGGGEDAVDKLKKYYAKFGFESLPEQPLRMFLPVKTIDEILASQ